MRAGKDHCDTISQCQALVDACERFEDVDMPGPCVFVDGKNAKTKDAGGTKIEVRPVDATPAPPRRSAPQDAAAVQAVAGYRDELYKHRHLELWAAGKRIIDRCEYLDWVTKGGRQIFLVDETGMASRVPSDAQCEALKKLKALEKWSNVKLHERSV